MNRVISMFFLEGTVDTVPSLRSSIVALVEEGYSIELFYGEDKKFSSPRFEQDAIHIHILPRESKKGIIARIYELMKWIKIIRETLTNKKVDIIIGVDPIGLLLAYIFASIRKCSIIYWSLEIYIESEIKNTSLKILKRCERFCHRHVALSITQDWDRARLLALENRVSLENIIIIPNAPDGFSSPYKSNYLHEKYNIPTDKKIVLHMGSVSAWTMSYELASEAKYWPDNWVLFFQSPKRLEGDAYAAKLLKLIDNRKIFLSTEPVDYCNVGDLVASADLGIALYACGTSAILGQNLYTMGLSSGKIGQYLKHGLPIIVVDFPSLSSMVSKYNCGFAIDNPQEIKERLSHIENHFDYYSENAMKCFDIEWKFSNYYSIFSEKICKIAGSKR